MTADQIKKNGKLLHEKPTLVIAFGLVFLLFIYLAWNFYNWRLGTVDSGNVFVIDGKQYSKKEVRQLIAGPTEAGIDENQSAKELYEILKRQKAGKKAGFKLDQSHVKVESSKLVQAKNSSQAVKDWAKLIAQDTVLNNMINEAGNVGTVKGYVYTFDFGRYIEKGWDYTPPHYNDKKYIEKDREYALKRAQEIQSALESKTISPENALGKVKSDPRLGIGGVADMNRSTKFQGEYIVTEKISGQPPNSSYGSSQYLPQAIINYMKDKEIVEGVNPIQEGKIIADVTTKERTDKNKKATFYFLIYATDASKDVTQQKYEKALKDLKSGYVGIKESN